MMTGPMGSDLRLATPAERPNGRRAKWREAKRPEAAPAIEARIGHDPRGQP
jgi:hypothetical protein